MRDLSKVPEISEMLKRIDEVQEGQDLKCSCKECYWNMWSPRHEIYNNEHSMQCVSESLIDFKMKPNSTECGGYWNYREACGQDK